MQTAPWLGVTLFGLLTLAGIADATEQAPATGPTAPDLWQAEDGTPPAQAFDGLEPGKSTREAVIAALGEPRREFNYYTEEGWVPVQLRNRTSRYGRDGEVRTLLRVLGYPGDRLRDAYYAVLRDDVLQYVIGPLEPEESEPEALRQRYGEPQMQFYQRSGALTAREVAWYPQQGLAFIRAPYLDERFNAKLVMEPRDSVPNAHHPLERHHGTSVRRRDPDRGDLADAFDELDEDELDGEEQPEDSFDGLQQRRQSGGHAEDR